MKTEAIRRAELYGAIYQAIGASQLEPGQLADIMHRIWLETEEVAQQKLAYDQAEQIAQEQLAQEPPTNAEEE